MGKTLKSAPQIKGMIDPMKTMESINAGAFSKNIKSMMLPESEIAYRLPDDNVAASALFEGLEIFTLETTPAFDLSSPGNRSTVYSEGISIINPTIYNGIYLSKSTTTALIPYQTFQSVDFIQSGAKDTLLTFIGANVALMPRELTPGVQGFEYPSALGDTFSFNTNVTLSMKTYTSAGILVDDTVIFIGNSNFVLTGACQFVRISLISNTPFDNSTYVTFFNTAAVNLPAGGTTFQTKSFDALVSMSETYKARCTALSVLTTYQGSDLNNGGQISSARLPTGAGISDAPLGDVYDYLASLPAYAGDYALKEGSYVWWLPDSLAEYDFKPYRETNLFNSSSLVTAVSRKIADDGETIRIRIAGHFETLTRSQQYHTEVTSYNPMLPEMIALAKTLPAVTCNPEHVGFFTRMWRKFKDAVSNPSNWIKAAEVGLPYLASIIA